MKTAKLWDIFCRVIDNYGDIGVCWRLAVGLAQRGQRVRLWLDDVGPLQWMAPHGAPGVEVRAWTQPLDLHNLPMGDVLVEAFGCDVAPEFIAAYSSRIRLKDTKALWINLEYLSAETFVERCHGLPSPVMSGPGAGLTKHFFYPGFTPATGGLLREPDLLARQAAFERNAWLNQHGIAWQGERLISLFCYEPPALGALLAQLARAAQPTRLLVTAGRATAAVQAWIEHQNRLEPLWNIAQALSISYLPMLTQPEFDHLLWACDLNLVRGEDSLVRGLWANKPFVWQIYPQHDAAHHAKLAAFLDMVQAPASLRAFHQVWNGISAAALPELALPEWQVCLSRAREQQLAQHDLVSELLRLGLKNH